MVREHYRVECTLDDPKTRLYRSHVGILLAALAAARRCTCQGPSPCSDGPDVDCPQHGDGRAAARDGAWATDTDGDGPLCSSCGIGHDRGECTPAAPRHFAPYGSTSATCDETVPRPVAWDLATGEYADARFTVRRKRVTCPECRWRLGLGPARDGEAASQPDLSEVTRYAQGRAIGEHARGRYDEERAWLDLLALIERAAPAVQAVTTEQVERLARQRADDVAVARGVEPWSDDSWAHVRHDLIRDEASRLRKAGIEVEVREP